MKAYEKQISLAKAQPYLKDIAGSISDHFKKTNITIKQVRRTFGFSMHVKVLLIPDCRLLSVQ